MFAPQALSFRIKLLYPLSIRPLVSLIKEVPSAPRAAKTIQAPALMSVTFKLEQPWKYLGNTRGWINSSGISFYIVISEP